MDEIENTGKSGESGSSGHPKGTGKDEAGHMREKQHSHHTSHHAKPSKPLIDVKNLKLKKKVIWQAATVILAILLVFSLTRQGCGSSMSAEEAGTSVVGFVTNVLLEGTKEAVLKDVEPESNLYKVSFEVDGQTYPSYVSSDGNLLFLQPPLNIEEMSKTEPQQSVEIPKSEKPVVELFVMSHCPYGTQVEKGMLPVADLLGDKIDFSVKFVYYAMHGKTELDEQLLQHCIQEEEPERYSEYLWCFLEEGKTEECIEKAGLNRGLLNTCIEETDAEYNVTGMFEDDSTWLNGRFPLFNVDRDLNQKYSVQGSPHIVINGVSPDTGRDSASILSAVCSSFTAQPEECATQLSSASPTPGFGFSEEEGAATDATCS
jgi:hypothetical protein